MIYLVTGQQFLFKSKDYEVIDVNKSIEIIRKEYEKYNWLGFDSETTGLDPWTKDLLSIAFGTPEIQVVIDITTVDINNYKSILESYNLIMQHGKFDVKFLFRKGIIPLGDYYDTMLAEQVIYQGYSIKTLRSNLDYLSTKYLNKPLNKSIRDNIIKLGWRASNFVKYAAEDVEVLISIKNIQEELIRKKGIKRAVELENKVSIVFGYMEYCGMPFSKRKWKKKLENDLVINNKLLHEFEDLLYKRLGRKKIVQTSLFFEDKVEGYNYNSPAQMIPMFESLGYDLSDPDTKSGKSLGKKNISKYKYDSLVKTYIKYQESCKAVSTYGEAIFEHINSVTGRIHTNYKQIISTGRISSSSPNVNNIPKETITRAAFESNEGYEIIDADYIDQEGRVGCNYANDRNMAKFYNEIKGDAHSYTAKLCFPKELEGVDIKDVKKKTPELRGRAKTARFAINYGGSGFTIAKNLAISEAEGGEIYNTYLKAFPDSAKYFDRVKQRTKKNGYIIISDITGRKYFSETGEIGHQMLKLALNVPIQGSSAEIVKLAMIMIWNWIIKNNYFMKVKLIGQVYDEIITEQPKELTDKVVLVVQKAMERAAKYYCKIVPLSVDIQIGKEWKH